MYEHTSLSKIVKNLGTLTYGITSLYIILYFLAKLANLQTYFDTVFLFNMLNLVDTPPLKKKNWNIVCIRGVTIAFDSAEGIWNGLPKLLSITSMACSMAVFHKLCVAIKLLVWS